MQDMSRVQFPRIPRTPGPDFAAPSDPAETAKLFRIDREASVPAKEVPGYEGPELDAEAGDGTD